MRGGKGRLGSRKTAGTAAPAEDRQPNEEINKRSHTIPPILRTSVPVQRGRNSGSNGSRTKYGASYYHEKKNIRTWEAAYESSRQFRRPSQRTFQPESLLQWRTTSGGERDTFPRQLSVSNSSPSVTAPSSYSIPSSPTWSVEPTFGSGASSSPLIQHAEDIIHKHEQSFSHSLPSDTEIEILSDDDPPASMEDFHFSAVRNASASSSSTLHFESEGSSDSVSIGTPIRLNENSTKNLRDVPTALKGFRVKKELTPPVLFKAEEEETATPFRDSLLVLQPSSTICTPPTSVSPPPLAQVYRTTRPQRLRSLTIRAKEEPDDSSLENTPTFPVTTGSRRYTPLPYDCQYAHNPNYKQARQRWALLEQRKLVRCHKHLKIVKTIIRYLLSK